LIIMAKKPAAPAEGATAPDKPAEKAAPEAKEAKQGKEPKEAREPKAPKAAKPPREKTTPEAPKKGATAPAAAEASGAAPAPTAAPAAPGAVAAPKKKGKRPGISPPRGKKLRNHLKNLQQRLANEGPSPLKKAIGVLKQIKRSKFDETVEVHMSLGVDTTQSDQLVRGTVSLPHGIGKSVRVLVFCQGDNVAKAKGAGADHAGSDDLIKQIQGGWTDFDIALATQDMMGQVSRLGKVLGPRGLMPTPKAGTVIPATGDIAAAVREFKAGKVEYRTDKGGNVHAGVGKLSFDEDKLADNITTFVEQVRSAKPAGVKGNYVHSITVSSTMGPGIAVTV
jgi:large subunit ribosomal protein L1